MIDARGNRSTTVYNIASQTIAGIDALGNRSTTIYDSDGRGFASINALGNRSTSVYDAAGRTVATAHVHRPQHHGIISSRRKGSLAVGLDSEVMPAVYVMGLYGSQPASDWRKQRRRYLDRSSCELSAKQ